MAAALLKVVALRLSTSTRQITLVGTIVLGYDVTYILLQFTGAVNICLDLMGTPQKCPNARTFYYLQCPSHCH